MHLVVDLGLGYKSMENSISSYCLFPDCFACLGLLDKPIEIIETRRERKKVERLSLSNDTTGKKKEGLDYSKVNNS